MTRTTVPPTSVQADDADGSTRRHTHAVVVSVVLLAVVVIGGAIALSWDGEALPGIAREPAFTVDGLEFVDYQRDDDGVVGDLVPDEGEVTVAYFGYLSCPDVCPTTMVDIAGGLRLLPYEDASRVTVAFVTIDAERDTGSEMRDYLAAFYSDLPNGRAALRADAGTTIEEAADRLDLYYEIEDHEPGAERYDVGHSAITYVIDDTGTVVRELPFGVTPEDVARVVEHTLDG